MRSQGTADNHTVTNTNHQTRGQQSPLGGGRPDPLTLHRDEDVASAPMTRTKGSPKTNNRGFITPIPGRMPTARK